MLDNSLKQQLKGYLDKLAHPLELSIAADATEASGKLRALLADIAALSPKITVIDVPHVRTPSFGIARAGEKARVRFAGIPLGHEFSSLVLALLQVGGHPPKVEPSVLDAIRALKGPRSFETVISLSCHNCPEVVQALNLMAVVNPEIEHTMIDGALFQEEVAQRAVMAVPTVFEAGMPFGQGRMGLEEIVAKVDAAAFEAASANLANKEAFDVLVVGAGPAGSTAAIYAARKGLRVGMVAERLGGQVADTVGIENFISVKQTEGPKLVAALEAHVRDYPVDVMTMQRAQALSLADGRAEVTLASGATLKARSVIVATGARWRELNVPGEQQYRGKGVAYCPHCDGPLFKGKTVTVVGGGNSGVEAAIDLAGIVQHVTLLEFNDALKADAVLQSKLATLPNVKVLTGVAVQEVVGDGQKMTALRYQERASGDVRVIEAAAVFVQIGLLPNTDWVRGVLELNRFGEIIVGHHGETSLPGVYAAGDVTTIPYKQIVMAVGDGARAALGAFDHLIRN